jgi:Glycosyl hydrolase family 12
VLVLAGGTAAAVSYAGGAPKTTGHSATGSASSGASSHADAGAKPSASARPSASTPSGVTGANGQSNTSGGTSSGCDSPSYMTSAQFGGWPDGNYYIANNMWNANAFGDVSQTLYACSYNNWYVVANMANDAHATVKTYPNVQMNFSSHPAISSLGSLDTTFAENSPDVGIYEDAYDIWVNGIASAGSTELMIWNQNHGQTPGGNPVASTDLDGQAYTVWQRNGEVSSASTNYVAFVVNTNYTSGSLNLKDFFNFAIEHDLMPASSTLYQVDYGVELVSTNAAPATFSFTNFSVKPG